MSAISGKDGEDTIPLLVHVKSFVANPPNNTGLFIQGGIKRAYRSTMYSDVSKRPRMVVTYDDGQSTSVAQGKQVVPTGSTRTGANVRTYTIDGRVRVRGIIKSGMIISSDGRRSVSSFTY